MGRLKNIVGSRVLPSIVAWGVPVLIVGCLLFVVNTRLSANPEPTRPELESYLQTNNLPVGAESVDGFQQVYYIHNGVKVFVTKDRRNHMKPVTSGRYVSWSEVINGFPQIVLYDFLDKTRIQITQTGTNLDPDIWGDKIVWEGTSGGLQQVFYFDGTEVAQISHDYMSVRPKIKDNNIIYAQYIPDEVDQWRVISHIIDGSRGVNPDQVIVQGGEEIAWPRFDGENIKTTL